MKIGTPVTPAPGNVHTNLVFLCLLFSSYEPVRDRRTDRRTGKTRNTAYKNGRIISTSLTMTVAMY